MKDGALYLEADEDITSAIDKLSKSTGSSVQIVVPKRSTLLQSIINLKLLKKAAEQTGKDLVLVTGDKLASDLAARVGLAVAPQVGAKAVVHEAAQAPEESKTPEDIIEEEDEPSGDEHAPDPTEAVKPPPRSAEPDPPKNPKKPFLKRMAVSDGPPGRNPLAAATSAAPALREGGDDAVAPVKPGKSSGPLSSKLPKVPNFHKLQRRLLWLGLGAFLIAGYFVGMYLFTSAKVTLYATGTKTSIDTTFSIDPEAKSTDKSKAVLAGQTVSVTKDLNGPFTPSGKKDAGTKAAGQMTVSNATGTDQPLVTGTRFQAPDGKVFRSEADITVPKATLNGAGDIVKGTATVDVTADAAGDSYNEAAAAYTLPALANPKITAQGGQMAGGTTKTITVVSQNDVDAAKAALLAKDKDAAARELKDKLPSGFMAIEASNETKVVTTTPSPAVGSEGETGQLALKVTYTTLAVKRSEFEDVIHELEQKQIGNASQVYEDGLKTAQITVTERVGAATGFHLTTEAYGGKKLDKAKISDAIKGQRYGDAMSHITGLPGVTKADIAITPGWVSKLPGRTDKITITIEVAGSK